MLIHPSFAELKLQQPCGISQSGWVTLSSETISRSQFVISREFLNSERPFEEPDYLKIGLPYKAGQIHNTSKILNSVTYNSGYEKFDFWHSSPNGQWPSGTDWIRQAFEQFIEIDRAIYGQEKVLWNFNIDIQSLLPGHVQRRFWANEGGEEPFHIDGGLGYVTHLKKLQDKINSSGYLIDEDIEVPVLTKGIPRSYTTVFTNPPDNRLQTEFKNNRNNFTNWDIVHFIGELHRSPEVPIACKRLFLRGVARPMV